MWEGKSNAGFGKNEGALVVLAEPLTRGKVALPRSEWLESREPCLGGRWERPGTPKDSYCLW